jgi:hypothetical protein
MTLLRVSAKASKMWATKSKTTLTMRVANSESNQGRTNVVDETLADNERLTLSGAKPTAHRCERERERERERENVRSGGSAPVSS